MGTKPQIPYRYIRGLEPIAQRELWRDLELLADAIGNISGAKVYDAYIDPSITSDSPSTLTFQTPFAAMRYVIDTLGKTYVNLGWIRSSTGIIATETANLGTIGTAAEVNIEVIGPEGQTMQSGFSGSSGSAFVQWDLATFTDSAKIQGYSLRGLYIASSVAGSGSAFFTRSSLNFYAENCYFNGSNSTVPSLPGGWYKNCRFANLAIGANSGTQVWYGCSYSQATVGLTALTITQSIIAFDSDFDYNGIGGIRLQTVQSPRFLAFGCTWATHGSVSGFPGVRFTFDSATTTRIHIDDIGEQFVASQNMELSITANIASVFLEGQFGKLTVAAPASAGGTSGNCHTIVAQVDTTFDVTGPANIALRSRKGGNFLRGQGLSGTATVWGDLNAGTALSFVNVDNSVLVVAYQGYSASPVAGLAYAIDAACSNNVFIMEGQSLFPGASTNASATTLVIDHSGVPPSGAAGGSLAGTYPNPTFAGRDTSTDKLNQDLLPSELAAPQSGVNVIPAATGSGGAPSGPAGGSLTGTYPNPTFAGRSSSGDKMDQDLLPMLFEAASGVNTIPTPTSGSGATTAQLDEIRKDLVPADMVGVRSGVVRYVSNFVNAPIGGQTSIPVITLDINGNVVDIGAATAQGATTAQLDEISKDAVPSELWTPDGLRGYGDQFASGPVQKRPEDLGKFYLKPTRSFETFPRRGLVAVGATGTGNIYMMAIALPAGFKITNINFATGPTAAVTPTHSWFFIADSAFLQLRVTADGLTAAFAANTVFTKALSSTYTTTREGVYYVGVMFTAATVCNFTGIGNVLPTGLATTAPRMALGGNTGQTVTVADGTNLASAPAVGGSMLYMWLT